MCFLECEAFSVRWSVRPAILRNAHFRKREREREREKGRKSEKENRKSASGRGKTVDGSRRGGPSRISETERAFSVLPRCTKRLVAGSYN